MARRALRKIDPSLELSRYFKNWESLPHPWDQAACFGRTAPLEFEVGSGKGLFIATASGSNPSHNFFGSEIALKYAMFAAAGLAKLERTNACIYNGDAGRLLAELFPDASLHAVHIYFPDPWWKKRHKKRRVVNPTLLANVQRTLEPGGHLHFWTDVEEYFQSGLELVAAHTQLSSPIEIAERPPEHDLDYHTHFERRTRLHEERVYRVKFMKAAESPAARAGDSAK